MAHQQSPTEGRKVSFGPLNDTPSDGNSNQMGLDAKSNRRALNENVYFVGGTTSPGKTDDSEVR